MSRFIMSTIGLHETRSFFFPGAWYNKVCLQSLARETLTINAGMYNPEFSYKRCSCSMEPKASESTTSQGTLSCSLSA